MDDRIGRLSGLVMAMASNGLAQISGSIKEFRVMGRAISEEEVASNIAFTESKLVHDPMRASTHLLHEQKILKYQVNLEKHYATGAAIDR